MKKAFIRKKPVEYVVWNDNLAEMKRFCGDECMITYELCSLDDYFNLKVTDCKRDFTPVTVPLHDCVVRLGDGEFTVVDRNTFEEDFIKEEDIPTQVPTIISAEEACRLPKMDRRIRYLDVTAEIFNEYVQESVNEGRQYMIVEPYPYRSENLGFTEEFLNIIKGLGYTVAKDEFGCRISWGDGAAEKKDEQEESKTVSPITEYKVENNGNCFVDLGLPSGTKWATCNLGASTPEEYGYHYMWGSMSPDSRNTCNWANAPFNGGNTCFDEEYFNRIVDTWDSDDKLNLPNDPVRIRVEGHMPTKEQILELFEHTKKSHARIGKVYGIMFSGPNGNSIFIPSSGVSMTPFDYDNNCIWSSTIYVPDRKEAWCLYLGNDGPEIGISPRFAGHYIRPVK